jgi:hypothetical protein
MNFRLQGLRLQLPCHRVLGAIASIHRCESQNSIRLRYIIIINNIIIIGKIAILGLSLPYKFYRTCRFRREVDNSDFTSSDFARVIFYRARSSAFRSTSNLEDQVPVYMSHSDRMTQLCPLAAGCIFVAFYDPQDCGGDTNR